VLDHVRERLDQTHRLSTLARVAHFSPFHFHRVFRAMTGETVRAWVLRARVERAVFLLGRAASRRSLTEVALACGFSSSAEFSRAFRAQVGVTPSAFRRAPRVRKNPQASRARRAYVSGHERVRVEKTPERKIAFVRVVNPFAAGKLEAAVAKLAPFARGRFIGLSHDDPAYTAPERCRYDVACVGGPSRFSTRVIPAGTYAVLRVQGSVLDVERAWDWLFAAWLPGSGFEPDDRAGEERFFGPLDFSAPLDVELALPIRR
jgi:AraC family transcriptional regulator